MTLGSNDDDKSARRERQRAPSPMPRSPPNPPVTHSFMRLEGGSNQRTNDGVQRRHTEKAFHRRFVPRGRFSPLPPSPLQSRKLQPSILRTAQEWSSTTGQECSQYSLSEAHIGSGMISPVSPRSSGLKLPPRSIQCRDRVRSYRHLRHGIYG